MTSITRPLLVSIVLCCILATPQPAPAVYWVGDPIEGGSWTQGFQQASNEVWNSQAVGAFDYFRFDFVAALGDFGSFEIPGLRAFTSGSGWAAPSAHQTTICSDAWGPLRTATLGFSGRFYGNKTSPLQFHTAIYRQGVLRQSQKAHWSGSAWTFTDEPLGRHDPGVIPEPGTALLIGAVLSAWSLCAWRRRQRS